MNELALTLFSAISIGIIIGLMATIQDKHRRSTIYSLPIPISVALIATGGTVDSTHIIGLVLINSFLWFVYVVFPRLIPNIFLADILGALLYVGLGYFAITYIPLSFWHAVLGYTLLWILAIILMSRLKISDKPQKATKSVSPFKKASVTTLLSFVLFSAKSALQGAVVTFPFSGVFAVVEGRSHLGTLAQTFTRNSLAILALFITVYLLHNHAPFWLQLSTGWAVYLFVLGVLKSLSVLRIRT